MIDTTKTTIGMVTQQDECMEIDPLPGGRQQETTLENLPPELRRQLLFALDFDQLRSLVHASPVFHQQYLLDRRAILSRYLTSVFGSVLPEACAVYRADVVGSLTLKDPARPEAMQRFHRSWRARSWSSQYTIAEEGFTADETACVISFYWSVVKPMVGELARWALGNLTAQLQKDLKEQHYDPLSMTEETRIVRALYRFQLSCLLFGNASRADLWTRHWGPKESIRIPNLFESIEPWEIEEIGCVYEFARDKFLQVFRDIQQDVHPDNPRFDDQRRPPTPDGAFELDPNGKPYPLLEDAMIADQDTNWIATQ